MSAEHPDNPSDQKAFDDLADNGARYTVLGTAVGNHLQGEVVSAKEFGRGSSLSRLLRLGAIAPLSEADAKAHREKVGELTPGEAGDAQRADPRFSTGSTAPAVDPKVVAVPDNSGPVRDDKPAHKSGTQNPPK